MDRSKGSSPRSGSHIYVLGEVEEPDGPVKIGITTGSASRSGRPNLNAGNWRTLVVHHRRYCDDAELRWQEWLIHQHLLPWLRRGEWFDVRHLVAAGDWSSFLSAALDGSLPGCIPWRLGDGAHRLVRMRRLTVGEPRQFDATCFCGVTVTGNVGKSLSTVRAQFAREHLPDVDHHG